MSIDNMEDELRQLRAENVRLKLERDEDHESLRQLLHETLTMGPMPAQDDDGDYVAQYMNATSSYLARTIIQIERRKRDNDGDQ